MKVKFSKYLIFFLLAFTTSCGEPETIVTDIVHSDGSITRRIEMRNAKNEFSISQIQVPYDSTWVVRDSLEVNEKGDTTWLRKAEKFYSDINELNAAYQSDSGANKEIERYAGLTKKFRWFYTEYRFNETINKVFKFGYPVSDFLNEEELLWFYNEDKVGLMNQGFFKPIFNEGKIDSVKYNEMDSLVKAKTEEWSFRNIISEWSGTFSDQIEHKGNGKLSIDSLKYKESIIYDLVLKNEDSFEKLWDDGTILKKFIGEENAGKYKAEADSSLELVTEKMLIDFSGYDLKIFMPGRMTGGNGYHDSSGCQIWSVKSDYFMTEPFIMYAESKITNKWAWIISCLFILFVASGIIFRKIKKGRISSANFL